MNVNTENYEYLLDNDSVLSVVADEEEEELEIRVADDSSKDEILPDNFSCEYDVVIVDEGFGEAIGGYEIEIANGTNNPAYRQDKIRSVMEGVSEGHKDITAGTAGPYIAEVVDKSLGEWSKNVSEGDYVRLSNNHVYANVNKASLDDEILQPGPIDGGDVESDTIGKLAGYLPVEDGCKADVAARTVDTAKDNPRPHALPNDYGTSIHRGDQKQLKGETVCNTGRTLGVRWGKVERTGASVNVKFGGDTGIIKLKNQIITEDMSAGGQSGSPVYREKNGELCGVLFAGGPGTTMFSHINQIESNFGIKMTPYGDSYSGNLEMGFSDAVALPTDKEFTITLSLTNNSKSVSYYNGFDFKNLGNWSVKSVSNPDVTLYNWEKKTKITFNSIEPEKTYKTDVTFKANDKITKGKSTKINIVLDEDMLFFEKSVEASVAESVIDYYKGDNDNLSATKVRQAISDYRDNRISSTQALKVMNEWRK